MSPGTVHSGMGEQMLKARAELYSQARAANPARWARGVLRDWSLDPVVWTTTPSKSVLAAQHAETETRTIVNAVAGAVEPVGEDLAPTGGVRVSE